MKQCRCVCVYDDDSVHLFRFLFSPSTSTTEKRKGISIVYCRPTKTRSFQRHIYKLAALGQVHFRLLDNIFQRIFTMNWHRIHASASIAMLRTLLLAVNASFMVSFDRCETGVIVLGSSRSAVAFCSSWVFSYAANSSISTTSRPKCVHSHRTFWFAPSIDLHSTIAFSLVLDEPRSSDILHRSLCLLVGPSRHSTLYTARSVRRCTIRGHIAMLYVVSTAQSIDRLSTLFILVLVHCPAHLLHGDTLGRHSVYAQTNSTSD